MNFELSDEQVMLRDAAAGALSRIDTVGGARAALDGGELPSLWDTAREAGWTGLLVPEEHGGAGLTALDAMLVMEQCGRRLTGAGLLGHLGATLVLSAGGLAGDLLPELADGSRRAALVWASPGDWTVEGLATGERRAPLPQFGRDGLTGTAGFQPDLPAADLLVVPARDDRGEVRAALIERAPVEEVIRYDATRPLGHLRLQGAEAVALRMDAGVLAEAWHTGQALLAADALGVAEAVLEMAVSYAKDRHAFGRAIGSYQAIKHQIVEIMRHAGTARSLCYYAGLAAEVAPGRAGACRELRSLRRRAGGRLRDPHLPRRARRHRHRPGSTTRLSTGGAPSSRGCCSAAPPAPPSAWPTN